MNAYHILAAVAILLAVTPPVRAIAILGNDPVTGTYSPQRHDRYYVGPDKDFIGAPLDLSGVSHAEWEIGSFGSWATMISDKHFISTGHFHPRSADQFATPGRVTFYREDSPTSEFWQAEPITGFEIGDSDIWIGELASAPPNWVRRYPLIKRPEFFNHTADPRIETDLFIIGRHHSPNLPAPMPNYPGGASAHVPNVVRVGRNTITTVKGTTGSQIHFTTDDIGFPLDESRNGKGDSGGPSFVFLPEVGSTLTGIHSSYLTDINLSGAIVNIQNAVPGATIVTDLLGDLNSDFAVDANDVTILSDNYGTTTGATYNEGDLNGDGAINAIDVTIFSDADTYGKSLLEISIDFDSDLDVDGIDFRFIADHWLQTVSPFTSGDATGDQLVNRSDVEIFAAFWRYPNLNPTPLAHMDGDANYDGTVDGDDQAMIDANYGLWNPSNNLPWQNGDANGDAWVNANDVTIYASNLGRVFGDLNDDGTVNINDVDLLTANWLETGIGDLDENGVVNATDLAALGDFWGTYVLGSASVAEPSSMTLALALIPAVCLGRRIPRKMSFSNIHGRCNECCPPTVCVRQPL